MFLSLALAIQLSTDTVKANKYTVALVGPMYDAMISWINTADMIKEREAMGPRLIDVYVAPGQMRCDTAKLVTVLKRGDEYVFLHHESKQALVLRGEVGTAAACTTTPFWPEAHGDASDEQSLTKKGGRLWRNESDGNYFYVPASDVSRREVVYIVCSNPKATIPNMSYMVTEPGKGTFDVFWRADHAYATTEVPRTVTVSNAFFSVPNGYSTFVTYNSDRFSQATTISQEQVKGFLARFFIHAAIPKTLLPGQN